MLKHILTAKCERGCSYCITKNVKIKESGNLLQLDNLYKRLSAKHKEIMITGGEPLLADFFNCKVQLAKEYFFVFVTTQSQYLLREHNFAADFQAITFSIHDRLNPLSEIYHVAHKVPVYASILADNYYEDLPHLLEQRYFSGLTINENQWGGNRFDERCLPKIKGFSIKVNRKGRCLNDTYILPDYRIVKGFHEFM